MLFTSVSRCSFIEFIPHYLKIVKWNKFYHLLDSDIPPEFTIEMGNRYSSSALMCCEFWQKMLCLVKLKWQSCPCSHLDGIQSLLNSALDGGHFVARKRYWVGPRLSTPLPSNFILCYLGISVMSTSYIL